MDGFTYIDIFETKGIEYLVIIGFLLLLIPFWIIINKQSAVAKRMHHALNVLTAKFLKIPQGLFYSKNHTWAYLEKSGNAKTGLDDFLLQIVGDIKIETLKFPGEKIKKGEAFAKIDQDGKVLSIISPITGEVVNSNPNLHENPELLNNDPYEKGWIYTIKPSNWRGETSTYYLADEATNWITNELERFKDFLAGSIGKYSTDNSMVVLQEGGEIRRNVLSEFDDKVWHDFEEEFMT